MQCGKAWTIASDCQVRRCKLRPKAKGSAGGDGKCGSKLNKEWMKETLITKKAECPSTEQVKAAYMRLKDSKKHDDKATCVGTDAVKCGVASGEQIKYTVCNSQEEETAPCDKKKFDCATGFTRTSKGRGGEMGFVPGCVQSVGPSKAKVLCECGSRCGSSWSWVNNVM